MATAKPSPASVRTRASPIRCAPPVTNAARGIGGTGKSPAVTGPCSASPAFTSLSSFLARPHFGARHVARRDACSPRGGPSGRTVGPGRTAVQPIGRKTEINLLEPADLVAQPRRLLEFELGGGLAHALFEIGDDGLQIGTLIVRRFTLGQSEGHVIALVDT